MWFRERLEVIIRSCQISLPSDKRLPAVKIDAKFCIVTLGTCDLPVIQPYVSEACVQAADLKRDDY